MSDKKKKEESKLGDCQMYWQVVQLYIGVKFTARWLLRKGKKLCLISGQVLDGGKMAEN